MEQVIKIALNTSKLDRTGRGGGGCINEGEGYITDNGEVFIKRNSKSESKLMFDGEFESLKAMKATNTVRVPTPLAVLENPKGGAVIAMEFIDMKSLNEHNSTLGEQLAKLHLQNLEQDHIREFGFHCNTCCGFIPQDNKWNSNWLDFYTNQKLRPQIDMLLKKCNEPELSELWVKLQKRLPDFFLNLNVKPSLLHGDLWGGNAAQTNTEPVVFDPASFYGHHEYDLAIGTMFGGFSQGFWSSYHKLIPKAPGFENRQELYRLFHYLNHWNHFGGGYKSSSISILRKLTK